MRKIGFNPKELPQVAAVDGAFRLVNRLDVELSFSEGASRPYCQSC
jgi:hypothetical protein